MSNYTQQDNISISPKACWLLILSALVFAFLLYPLYQNGVERQTHKEAVKALNKAADLQAQYFVKYGVYTDQVKDLGLPASGGVSSFMTVNWQYRVNMMVIDKNGQPHYVLTTVPYGSGADKRTIYKLDSDGDKFHQLPGKKRMSGWGI